MREIALEIEIPLPPKAIAQNARCHWRRKHEATKSHRTAAKFCALAALQRGYWEPCKIRIHSEWFMGKKFNGDGLYRPLDIQNAIGSLKAAVDGLIDAGIAESDGHKHVQWGETILHRAAKEHKGKCAVVLRIEVID